MVEYLEHPIISSYLEPYFEHHHQQFIIHMPGWCLLMHCPILVSAARHKLISDVLSAPQPGPRACFHDNQLGQAWDQTRQLLLILSWWVIHYHCAALVVQRPGYCTGPSTIVGPLTEIQSKLGYNTPIFEVRLVYGVYTYLI